MMKIVKKKNSIIADDVGLCHRKILITSTVTDWSLTLGDKMDDFV